MGIAAVRMEKLPESMSQWASRGAAGNSLIRHLITITSV